MQKSISMALEKWSNKNEDSVGASPRGSSFSVANKTDAQDASSRMKNIFQLNKFAKSPSSAQIIFEE